MRLNPQQGWRPGLFTAFLLSLLAMFSGAALIWLPGLIGDILGSHWLSVASVLLVAGMVLSLALFLTLLELGALRPRKP